MLFLPSFFGTRARFRKIMFFFRRTGKAKNKKSELVQKCFIKKIDLIQRRNV